MTGCILQSTVSYAADLAIPDKVLEMAGEAKVSLIFDKDTDRFVISPEEFLYNFDSLMPGDTQNGRITIQNESKKKLEIAFYAEIKDELTDRQKDFIDSLKLKIYQDERQIYKGGLLSASQAVLEDSPISLGIFGKDDISIIDIALEIPKELDNVYTLNDVDFTWVFTANEEYVETVNETKMNETKPSETSLNETKAPRGKDAIAKSVYTGDIAKFYLYIILGACAGIMFVLILIIQKYKKRGGKS